MTSFNTTASLPHSNDAVKDRKFQARVVDNEDPLMKQRIKVEIPNLMEGPPDMLPWVGPLVQSKFGMTEEAVSVAVPVVGSVLEVEFQDGDLAYGVCTGSLHTELSASLGPLEINYPRRRGWYDPKQNWSYIDITDGQVEFQLHHYSGTQYTTYDDGRVHHLAVELYHIEAPDIKEQAYDSHVVTSTTSEHTATDSHKLTTTDSDLIASAYHKTETPTARFVTADLFEVQSSGRTQVVANGDSLYESYTHIVIRAPRVDINP